MDVPQEVFDVIAEHIVRRNSFGHIYNEAAACITIEFTNRKKAVFVFDKINLEGTVCAKENILVKFVTSPT
jgi:hypothetical protein